MILIWRVHVRVERTIGSPLVGIALCTSLVVVSLLPLLLSYEFFGAVLQSLLRQRDSVFESLIHYTTVMAIGTIKLVGLAYLIVAAMFMISALINRSELRTREKLLEIELKLGEIAERLKRE